MRDHLIPSSPVPTQVIEAFVGTFEALEDEYRNIVDVVSHTVHLVDLRDELHTMTKRVTDFLPIDDLRTISDSAKGALTEAEQAFRRDSNCFPQHRSACPALTQI